MTESGFGSETNRCKRKRAIRKYSPFLLFPLIIVSFLVGCQIQNSVDEIVATPTFDNPHTTSTVTSAAPTATVPVENKLVIWLPPQFDPQSGNATGALIQGRLDAFEKDHPQWSVEVRLKATSGRGGLLDALSTTSMAAPNALPALIVLQYQDMESAVLKGLLLPLRDQNLVPAMQNLLPYAAQMSQLQGETYGFPLAGDALALVYHPTQTPYPPTTWQELSTQRLPIVFPAGDPEALVVANIYQTAGGNLLDFQNVPASLEAIPLEKSFAILNNGVQSGAFPIWLSQLSNFTDSWNAYKQQPSGYAIVWASQYLQDKPANSALVPLPAINSKQFSLAQGWVWCIPEMSPQSQEAAAILAGYLSDPTFTDELDQLAGYLPVYSSGLASIQDLGLNQTIKKITSSAQIIPTGSTIDSISPIFEDSTIQIIKQQIFYEQEVQQALSHSK